MNSYVERGLIGTCPIVDLEILFSARTGTEHAHFRPRGKRSNTFRSLTRSPGAPSKYKVSSHNERSTGQCQFLTCSWPPQPSDLRSLFSTMTETTSESLGLPASPLSGLSRPGPLTKDLADRARGSVTG
jgi:hypothetical protein